MAAASLTGRSLIRNFSSLLVTSGGNQVALSNSWNDACSRIQHATDAERTGCAATDCRYFMQKDLADVAGKEMVMLTVEYPPGAVEHVHRHDAYAFVYVLEGSIIEGGAQIAWRRPLGLGDRGGPC
jgi:hypothetical protein